MKIHVASMYQKVPAGMIAVDTTSRSGKWSGLSPFNLGPHLIYQGAFPLENDEAQNFENLWQYAKVYACHIDGLRRPTQEYWKWARLGWLNPKAVRYPMGRGAKPEYSLWKGKQLGYIEARKAIYGPIYEDLVVKTDSYAELKELAKNHEIVLRDYDGYDHEAKSMTLTEVLNCPQRKMGHSFVLKMLLTSDPALQEFV